MGNDVIDSRDAISRVKCNEPRELSRRLEI